MNLIGAKMEQQLERIAAALERIANALEHKPKENAEVEKQDFGIPWRKMSYRLRKAELRSRQNPSVPTTPHQLIEIGRKHIINREWRNVGEVTVKQELDPIMEQLGLGQEWMDS